MFSKSSEYSIKALIFIAQKTWNGQRVSIKEVAKGIDSPEYFIGKILQVLSKKGFVRSAKGPNGGFYMDEKTLCTPLAEIVKEFEGDKIFTGCALGLDECSETRPCPLHNEFKKIRNDLSILLNNTKIETYINDLNSNLTFLKR